MRGWLRLRLPSRDERGTSLVLALAFMTLFGTSAALLAQFGSASFQSMGSVRDQRGVMYAAEGAVDTAIDYVRGNAALGTNGGSCPTLSFPSAGSHTIDATCVGQAAAGGGSGTNFPTVSLLTMATGSEVGINLGSFAAGTAHFGGPVFSNSGISANQVFGQGSMDAGPNPVTARGACTGTITGTPVACNVGPGGHPEGNDPNYPSPLSTIPARQNVPVCPASGNKVIPFTPGFYDDETGLANLTNGSCPNAVLWFQPGAYYFDFDLNGGGNVWLVADQTVNIVGGTPKGWSPTSPTRPTIPTPGACKIETDPAPNAGVQFVWGGDSQWQFAAGNSELCASLDSNGRELVLYGQKTGTATPASTTLKPTGASAISGWPSPLTPSNALNAIDNTVTTANISGKSATGSMTVAGYNASGIPAGSAINSVQLRVAHRESVPANVNSLTATVNGTGASCAVPITTRPALGTDPLYSVPCITSVAQLSGLGVIYAAQLTNSNSATSLFDLDGLEIVVSYTPPALRAQSGCILVPGGFLAFNPSTCSFVALTSLFGGQFLLNGTVYAPLARLDLELTFATRVQITRGMIARSVGLWDLPAPGAISNSVWVPPAVRSTVFIGRVDGVRRVRAVVDFTDAPTVGSQAVVRTWTAQ
jgi:hypothetical protein